MGEHDGHRARMLRKFRMRGLESFEPHEALEVLLYYARPRVNTNELAHKLISQFGSLNGVFDAPMQELERVEGVGEYTATLIKLVPQIMVKYKDGLHRHIVINDSFEAARFLFPLFFGKTTEAVVVLCLDAKNKLIFCSEVYEGGINAVEMSVSKVVSSALNNNAAKVVLAHNHPSGNALPSRNDLSTTAVIAQTLENIRVQLFDHIIFGDNDCVSMRDSEK